MTTLQEKFDSLPHWHPTVRKQFARLLMKELSDDKYWMADKELSAGKSDFLSQFLRVYLDIVDQKFSSIEKTEILFKEFCKRSAEIETFLTAVFETVFDKLDNVNINWDSEQEIEPIERYLLIQDKIPFVFPANMDFLKRESYDKYSDTEFENLQQEFRSLLKEAGNTNLLSVGINYSYGYIVLPKTYDIIFDVRDMTKYWEQKTIVKYAFNYGTYFHTDLWRGHHAHCLIEVIGDIPGIFSELPINNGGISLHAGIGLCTRYDWQYIKDKRL